MGTMEDHASMADLLQLGIGAQICTRNRTIIFSCLLDFKDLMETGKTIKFANTISFLNKIQYYDR